MSNEKLTTHNVGDMFIGKREGASGVVFTIVKVIHYANNPNKVFGYDVYDTYSCAVRTMNDWWLDDYTNKV